MGVIVDKVLAFMEAKVGKAQYSKTYRMKSGFFDCSSFIYRAYKAAGVILRDRTSGKPVSTSCYEVYAKQFKLVWPASYALIGKKLPTASSLLPSLGLVGGEHIFYNFKATPRANKITHVSTVRAGGKGLVHARNPKVDVCHNALTWGDDRVCAVVRFIEPETTTVPVTPASTPTPVTTQVFLARILKFGCKGQDVRELQKILTDFGCKVGTDSVFGFRTRNAVIKFQKAHGLDGDGKVGKLTAAALGFTWTGK